MARITVGQLGMDPYLADLRSRCYHCGDPLGDPGREVVYWSGFGEPIVLHLPCGERLGMRLYADATGPMTPATDTGHGRRDG